VKVFNLFLGPLGAMFIVGVFLPFVGSAAVILATVLGVIAAVSLCFAKELFGLDSSPSPLLVTSATTIASVIVAALLSLVLPRPSTQNIEGHTWWTRHKIRPSPGTE